jgi:diacylglycerol kinase family enzyme
MPRDIVIVNSTAGRGASEQAIPQIEHILNTHGLDFDLVRTERPWHAAELAQQASNTGYDVVVAVGGGFYMAPEGRPDDGLFDLCIAHEVSRARIFGLIPHFLRGTQATQEPIRTGQATTRVVVTAVEGGLPAHADGEALCIEGQRLGMELLPSQIDIVCPPPEAAE